MSKDDGVKRVVIGQAGSKMQSELDADQGLAEQYLKESRADDLYALYQKRCKQLEEFGSTLCTMAEMYAGKGERHSALPTADAVSAMERVAMAAIELAKAIASK